MSSKHYSDALREAAADYYDVAAAERFLDSPVHEGCVRWRCVLCGYPMDVTPETVEKGYIQASCCGGCGMTCMRPIEEFEG